MNEYGLTVRVSSPKWVKITARNLLCYARKRKSQQLSSFPSLEENRSGSLELITGFFKLIKSKN